MDGKTSVNNGKWCFTDYKVIKILKSGKKHCRISFQRKGKYTRGLSISMDAFYKLEDVSLTPAMRIELEANVWIINHGSQIHLVKYCYTRDNKRCDGGLFIFTPKEWMTFWTKLRPKITRYLNE